MKLAKGKWHQKRISFFWKARTHISIQKAEHKIGNWRNLLKNVWNKGFHNVTTNNQKVQIEKHKIKLSGKTHKTSTVQ